ncbi:hypothetical protein APED_02155 [Acanthopleuribacter pedis]
MFVTFGDAPFEELKTVYFDYPRNPSKIRKMPPVYCIDRYLEPYMGWKEIKTNRTQVKKSKQVKQAKVVDAFSLSYLRTLVVNPVSLRSKYRFNLFLRIFSHLVKTEILYVDDDGGVLFDDIEVGPHSELWKTILEKYDNILFYNPAYEVSLGGVEKRNKGYIYEFTQGTIRKHVYIDLEYISWPLIYHYWSYYGTIQTDLQCYDGLSEWGALLHEHGFKGDGT